MLQPLVRALSQLNDPVFLGVVWRSFALSLFAFCVLLLGSTWLLHEWVGQGGGWLGGGWLGGWLGWLAGALGGVGVLLLAVWLYVPVALLIATFYVERVAGAVERRFYPGLPPPSGAALAEQGWDGVVLAAQVLALQIVTLIASIVLPGVGLVIGYAVTGWAIGRGLFVSVAMRRMPRQAALLAYRSHFLAVVAPGIVLALASALPPLNLLVPVVGIATMVHVASRPSDGAGL